MLNEIIEQYPDEDFLKADGFDDAVIGIDVNAMRLIYSICKCKSILVADGMDELDAEEFLWYNTITAYMGKKTPIWCDDEF